MNRIAFLSTVLITAILIGCQAPVGPESVANPVTAVKGTAPSWIPLTLSGVIQMGSDIGGTAKLGVISGTASYLLTYPSKDQVKLNILMDCVLKPLAGTDPAWNFTGKSEDLMQIPPSGTPTFVIKKYAAGSVGGGMMLNIKYRVVEGIVSVESMWATELPWVSGS